MGDVAKSARRGSGPGAEQADRESKQKLIEAEHVNDYINAMTSGGRAQMLADHDTLRKKERHVYYFMRNPSKNRFTNIVLFNEGAIVLEKQNKDETTYIHATRIRSKYGNYIMAQAPTRETLMEWFRMIWQCKVKIIVCLLPLDNQDECHKYFEKKQGRKIKCKRFSLKTFAVRAEGQATMFEMRFYNNDAKSDEKERMLHIIYYPKWQIAHPIDPRILVKLIRSMWALEHSLQMADEKSDINILVHGTSGVRRTGAFVVSSMLCKQIRDKSTLSVVAACSTVRRYRYGVMRNKLIFCTTLETVLNFAADQGLIDRGNRSFVECIKKIRMALMDGNNDGTSRRDHEDE